MCISPHKKACKNYIKYIAPFLNPSRLFHPAVGGEGKGVQFFRAVDFYGSVL